MIRSRHSSHQGQIFKFSSSECINTNPFQKPIHTSSLILKDLASGYMLKVANNITTTTSCKFKIQKELIFPYYSSFCGLAPKPHFRPKCHDICALGEATCFKQNLQQTVKSYLRFFHSCSYTQYQQHIIHVHWHM